MSDFSIEWADEDGRRHRSVLAMRPVSDRYADIYRRRGMEVPTAHTGHLPGALVAYRWRNWHRSYADRHRLFWLPCPLCGKEFGGHEIGDSIPDPTRQPNGYVCICPECTAHRNGGRA